MTFALFNQSEEYRSIRNKKSVLEIKNGVTGAKANIRKENFKKYTVRNLVWTVNPTIYMITNIYTQ